MWAIEVTYDGSKICQQSIPASEYESCSGLPHITIPGTKLEPGRRRPASGLAEAERRADQMLAARSLLGPAADS